VGMQVGKLVGVWLVHVWVGRWIRGWVDGFVGV
jgi:hypothetical protein